MQWQMAGTDTFVPLLLKRTVVDWLIDWVWRMCGGQRKNCENQFPPSTLWVLGIELKSSDLATITFTFWAN